MDKNRYLIYSSLFIILWKKKGWRKNDKLINKIPCLLEYYGGYLVE